jgi:ABC-2 type transport system ATP-binding protein
MSNGLAVELHHVEKVYRGRIHALRGVGMAIRRGEIFGLLGPNGAGKSTLVKILLSIVRPTRCEGTLLDHPIGHKPTLARVGFLPESHRFPRYLTGRQVLDFFGAMTKVGHTARKRRADHLLELVGMTAAAERRIGTYSKGMAQRLGVAQALMNDPDLVLLDEPTDGVDPVARRQIRDVLADLRAAGKTVFINSHQLSELELICDRVAILVGGRVAMQGTLDELAITRNWYEIEFADDDAAPLRERVSRALSIALAPREPPAATLDGRTPAAIDRGELVLNGDAAPTWVELERATLRLGAREPGEVQPVLDRLRAGGLTIRRMLPVRPTLEDLFIEAVRADTAADASRGGPR